MPCTSTTSGTPGLGSPTARLRIRPSTPSWYDVTTSRGNSGMADSYPNETGMNHHGGVMKLPREIAGFDSASGMVVALARFLHWQDTPPLGKPVFRALAPIAALVARLPVPSRQGIYSLFSGAE